MAYVNRRRFLQGGAALGFMGTTGVLAGLSAQTAAAADFSGYKALVCVFLKGGLDHADTVLPYDSASHAELAGHRANLFSAYGVGSGNASRDIQNMLELQADNIGDFGGRRFALPPEFSDMHQLFADGDAAIVGNVGPLIEPTTRDAMNNFSAELPARLFSHNDQQSTWMSLGVEGTRTGWGGKFLDVMINADVSSNPVFSAISTSGSDVFLAGDRARVFSAPEGGAQGIDLLENRWRRGSGRDSQILVDTLRDHLSSSGLTETNLYMKDMISTNARAMANSEFYTDALESGLAVSTSFPDTNLASQLETVANTIAIRNALNVRRQIFYVSIGGFDTHDSQRNDVPQKLAEIGGAVASFKAAMQELGVWNDVTLFTASDFGRTVIDNGDGTDHGWGAHHFVVGGAVAGKRIYGDIPGYDLGDQVYTEDRGRLIPTTSVDQYAASLGSWFGLSQSELQSALPHLNNFSVRDLGLFAAST